MEKTAMCSGWLPHTHTPAPPQRHTKHTKHTNSFDSSVRNGVTAAAEVTKEATVTDDCWFKRENITRHKQSGEHCTQGVWYDRSAHVSHSRASQWCPYESMTPSRTTHDYFPYEMHRVTYWSLWLKTNHKPHVITINWNYHGKTHILQQLLIYTKNTLARENILRYLLRTVGAPQYISFH